MDTPSSNSLLQPRIRLLRRTPSPRAQESSDMDFTPVAGPSSARSQFNVVDEEDDNQPTPRMSLKTIPSPSSSYSPNYDFGASTSSAIPSDTPAARLRALLARTSDSPNGKYPSARPFAPFSESGAGTAPSRFTPATPSVIRDSLKDLFSHARRDPGDTPQKSRLRRNSFDSSEMDITPVIGREREQHKGKRKSLSDDEADIPKSSKGSESSFRLSHAATYDTLRVRLMSSRSQLLDQQLPSAVYDVSSRPSETDSLQSKVDGPANANPTTALLQPLESSLSLHPISADSHHGTFQLPQLVSHSNLLDQDSDMQHAMGGLDTSEDVPASTLDSSSKGLSTTPLRPRSSLSFRGRLRSHDQSRRASLELPGSRASSTLSNADFKGQQHSRGEERNHQREREWNRPKVSSRPVTPELQHRHSLEFHRRHSQEMPWTSPSHVKSLSHEAAISRSGSPLSVRNLQRRGSIVSLRSVDDDRSSRPSSMSSQADYRDRMAELDKDRYIEREREWNKRQPPPRPSSSLSSSSSHSHTHPVRSPSAAAYTTPTHASLRRKASSPSLNRLSGASSPASSLASHESHPEDSEEQEVTHERERNWNSPHPKWGTARHHSHVSGNEVTSPGAHLSRSGSGSSRPSSRASGVTRSSLIPVRATSKKNGIFSSSNFDSSTPAKANDEEQFTKGHRRRSMEFTESVITIPPQTGISAAFEDMVLASDEESVSEFVLQSTTPDTSPKRSQEDAPSETESEVVSPPDSPPRQRGSPVQSPPGVPSNDEARLRRALASTSTTSFRPRTPDSPLKTPPAEETTPPSFTPPGTPPSVSPAPQDVSSSEAIPTFALTTPPRRLSSSTSILDFRTPSPPHDLSNLSIPPSSSEDEVETREADITPLRADEDNITNPNLTTMKTPRPPGGWAFTPVPSKHAHRETSPPPAPSSKLTPTAPISSSSTSLSWTGSEPERHSKQEAQADNGLLTPISSLSRANSVPLRTPAPPGGWMSTPNQPNDSVDQSQFGSVGRRKSILKVRFDVAESEASTAEVEHHISAPNTLPNGHVPQAESVLPKKTSGSAQADVIRDPVQAKPVTPERSTTPVSRANAPSPRSLRKSPSLKVVDAFGRERTDIPPVHDAAQDTANGRADAKDAIHPSSSAETPHTPRNKSNSSIRIVDAMGREIEEEAALVTEPPVDEGSSVLHNGAPIGRTEALSQMRQTLREWADGLSDGDRSADDLALNTSHLEELEEVSRAARHARNQLAQTLRVESVKSRDLMHKYAKDAVRSGRMPTVISDNSSFHRGLVWFGVVIQIIFVLAMWRFAHGQARRLFYTVYYDPLYPDLTPLPGQSRQFSPSYPSFPWSLSRVYEILKHEGWTALRSELQGTVRRIGEHAWERWGEPPYAGTGPPT